MENTIPNVIHCTYKSKESVPKYIWEQYSRFAPGYQMNFADDDASRQTVARFSEQALVKYDSFSNPAHKADLFRYCILYEKGGIYFDIKTILTRPVDEMFPIKKNRCYTILSIIDNTIYQGVLAFPPRSQIILAAIHNMLSTQSDIKLNYLIYTYQLYRLLVQNSKTFDFKHGTFHPVTTLKTGDYNIGNTVLTLYAEVETKEDTPLDKWGHRRIDVMNNVGEKICVIRDHRYPW